MSILNSQDLEECLLCSAVHRWPKRLPTRNGHFWDSEASLNGILTWIFLTKLFWKAGNWPIWDFKLGWSPQTASANFLTLRLSFLCSFVGHLLMTGSGGWLGLNDRSKESRFLWNYNKFDQPAYFAWDKGDGKNPEPNNFNGQCNVENCVEMNSVNKKWNDVVCKAHRSYVCERTFAEGED